MGKKNEFKYYITNTKHWTEHKRGENESAGEVEMSMRVTGVKGKVYKMVLRTAVIYGLEV